ncbi:hypothetical protein WAF17_06285 [Bernardetia sp. ABR2-2B]|uniref:hypothetical protein n=1 Tax=Bernardetia sp. ABR2-2B TaxID=3127472 RepID=UPI0030D25F0A
MNFFIKILLIIFVLQSCTTSKTRIEDDFICDGEEEDINCCQENRQYINYLNTLNFSKLIKEYKLNGKVYKDYLIGNDKNYTISFFCIKNEANQILYYQKRPTFCGFYINTEEGKKVKENMLDGIPPPPFDN